MLEQSQIEKIVDAVMAELTPNDDSARERMKNATPARIDVGRCGPRRRKKSSPTSINTASLAAG